MQNTVETVLVEMAISIALGAHQGQLDKGKRPYILHPLWVMSQMQTADEQIVAALHDVAEDSDHTLEALECDGFPSHIIAAIDHLTRRKGERYSQYIDRVSQNELATKVKIADLRHNRNLSRLGKVTEKDVQRAQKYDDALAQLLKASGQWISLD